MSLPVLTNLARRHGLPDPRPGLSDEEIEDAIRGLRARPGAGEPGPMPDPDLDPDLRPGETLAGWQPFRRGAY